MLIFKTIDHILKMIEIKRWIMIWDIFPPPIPLEQPETFLKFESKYSTENKVTYGIYYANYLYELKVKIGAERV